MRLERADWLPLGANTDVAGPCTRGEPAYRENAAIGQLGSERLALLEGTVGDDGTVCVHFLTGRYYTNRPDLEMPDFLSFEVQ